MGHKSSTRTSPLEIPKIVPPPSVDIDAYIVKSLYLESKCSCPFLSATRAKTWEPSASFANLICTAMILPILLAPRTPHVARHYNIAQKSKQLYMQNNRWMQAVGFEPTHLSIVELKSTALDHSAKLAGTICRRQRAFMCIYITEIFNRTTALSEVGFVKVETGTHRY